MKNQESKKSLDYIFPEKPTFFLSSMKKEYTLRIPNVSDQVWFKKHFESQQAILEMMQKRDWPNIVRVVFHHLSNEDKRDFLAQDAKIINDDGEEMEVRLTGPEVLMLKIVGEEAEKVLAAFTRALMLGNPIVEIAVMDELKKKGIQLEPKKSKKPIGRK